MPEATEQSLRDMMSGLSETSSDTLTLYMEDAKDSVLEKSFSISHSRFAQLHRYKTADLLTRNNIGVSDIKSESVADVKIEYGKNSEQLDGKYANTWERRFHQTITEIRGLANRCL